MGYIVVLLLSAVSVFASTSGHFIESSVILSAAGICFVLESKK